MEFTNFSIRKLIDSINSGQIRVPAFQRGFVWDYDRVAHLLDSIYKKFPFGSLLFWRTKNRLNSERKLGPFSLPRARDEYPVDYVLDGQQRITSIFCVFQSDIPWPADEEKWPSIYFIIDGQDDLQESRFVILSDGDVDFRKHFPVSTLFDVVKYREATDRISGNPAAIRLIDDLQQRFKEAQIPIQLLDTEERGAVAIVFERINRLGMELDTLQLLSAWTWNEDFHLLESFKTLKEELEEFGFSDVGEDSNLVLRCASAVLQNDPLPDKLIELNGAEIRAQFPKIRNGIKGAIDYLRNEIGVRNLKNLPYDSLLTPLSVFFACHDGQDISMTDQQRKTMNKWFWRSCFTNRYSSQTRRTAQKDIIEMLKLKNRDRTCRLSEIEVKLDENYFVNNQYRLGTAITKTFVLLLVQGNPKSFISGNAVDLDKVLQKYNRAEFHHIYPRAFLKAKGITELRANCLANFAVINGVDNRALGGKAPGEYRRKMSTKKGVIGKILKAALCPECVFTDDYDKFLNERKKMLHGLALKLLGD